MGEVVDLGGARREKAAASAFARWEKRLGHAPVADERLGQLPDGVLSQLAELDQTATLALYDVVLGVRGWGAGEAFSYLEPAKKMEALDAFLFLADQVRFEVMRRLGWLRGIAAERHGICDLALHSRRIQAQHSPALPELTSAYPRFEEMQKRLRLEPEAAIRSLIPEALAIFRRRAGR
ncbi:conserved hypothetical protein [Desulfarculus baarsii DSM 2075]|uniref:Uncharacterized protein n=1 Tax=Desulfarculus baarsii (strain ATCC 33931 / DSM 2075 / LMG 7858 / VKM B-1802 / 2st14) TaxID=644282 RepID=E1QK96_DESB2|nr:hypothetical protein [Desulfarculus baarsii]ADK85989.1 conserved hypothetical protein [Desulfarculus baarsii DSM 2075]